MSAWQAVAFIVWTNVCTYVASLLMYDRPPELGAWVLTWLLCGLFLTIARVLNARRSKR